MDDKPDVGQGTGSPSSPDGGFRRDRRRLRESARAEAQESPVTRDEQAASSAAPDTGGFSAFEALGFERRSFEPPADPAPADVSRFRDVPGPAAPSSPAAGAPLTPPQAAGVTPPAYGSDPALPVAQPFASEPPPLEEPPRPAVPPVTHAFAAPTLLPSTQQPPARPHDPTSAAPLPDGGVPDAAAHELRPAAFSAPPVSPRVDGASSADAPSAAELYSPPTAAAPLVSPAPMPPVPTQQFGAAPIATGTPSSSFPQANPSVALTAPVVPPAPPRRDAEPAAVEPIQDPAAGGHPVLGPLTPRRYEEPQEVVLLDRIALAAAIVLPPIGFVLGLMASARGRAYRGWASAMARASLWVAVVMTFVFIVLGVFLWSEHQKRLDAEASAEAAAAAHAALVEESAAFCGALAASPVLAEGDPEFGWPSVDDPAGYIPAISAYAATWQGLVPVAPAVIAEQVASASAQVDQIVANAASLPEPHRAGDLLDVQAVAELSAVQTHAAEYCGPADSGE